MSYRLEDGESVRDGLRRCSREQLDAAIQELTEAVKADPVEAIHEARKALKKQRSLLRLARATLDPDERRQEATGFRDVARSLSGSRDADVMIEGLDDLAQRFVGTVPERTLTAARTRLLARRDEQRDQAASSGSAGAVA
ncbi:MAG TPA: CHAD domain-containing protein, partial [Solirubrobacteraceae bacterium]